MKAQKPEYRNVVIKGQTHRGWSNTYLGLGRMDFEHEDGKELRLRSDKKDWARDCWEQFLLILRRDKCGDI